MLLVSMANAPLHIFVPCHNRRAITTDFIEHLYHELPKASRAIVHLIDDGSTDGTSQDLATRWPDMVIHRLNGQAFWGGCLYYIQDYAHHALPIHPDPLILIANDDIHFQARALTRAWHKLQTGAVDVLIPILIDVPESHWSHSDWAQQPLAVLSTRKGLTINCGDYYESSNNRFSRLASPGATNIGVTAALLTRRSCLIQAQSIPRGMPHYGSDFWLTHSLACQGYRLATDQDFIVFRRAESTRPSSRGLGRLKYWQNCCNPSSPDYLPSSITFQRHFSEHPKKKFMIWLLVAKFLMMRLLTRAKPPKAHLEASLTDLFF
jgi:hypothetical protein